MNKLHEINIVDFLADSGEITPSINLSYQLFGKKLGDAPIILVNHALTGNSNLTGKNGWWKEVIGDNKAINTKAIAVPNINQVKNQK